MRQGRLLFILKLIGDPQAIVQQRQLLAAGAVIFQSGQPLLNAFVGLLQLLILLSVSGEGLTTYSRARSDSAQASFSTSSERVSKTWRCCTAWRSTRSALEAMSMALPDASVRPTVIP
jgi:hypothetical protein